MIVALTVALLLQSSQQANRTQSVLQRQQYATDSLAPRRMRLNTAEQSGRLNKSMGECLYRRNQIFAERFLKHSDNFSFDDAVLDKAATAKMIRGSTQECLEKVTTGGVTMVFSPQAFRALLLEESYLAHVQSAPSVKGEQGLNRRTWASPALRAQAQSYNSLATCVVGKDISSSDLMMRTQPGTQEEKLAMQKLAPSLGACITAGQSHRLTPTAVRSLVADGLWYNFVGASTPVVTNSR